MGFFKGYLTRSKKRMMDDALNELHCVIRKSCNEIIFLEHYEHYHVDDFTLEKTEQLLNIFECVLNNIGIMQLQWGESKQFGILMEQKLNHILLHSTNEICNSKVSNYKKKFHLFFEWCKQ